MITPPRSEKGQAIIMIVFAIVGLFALIALAIDGGNALSDRRQAQNAADTAAMAAALSYQMENGSTAHVQSKVLEVALANGYDNLLPRSTVTVNANGTPVSGVCPGNKNGKDFLVTIQSNMDTWFAAMFGVPQVHNTVVATARGCEKYFRSFYDGNAIVSLAPPGTVSFNASGNANWTVACQDGTVSGGIFANGDANLNGNADVISPSLTIVGAGASDFAGQPIPQVQAGSPYAYPADIISKMPKPPACDGTARLVSGVWYPDANSSKDGSVIPVALNGGQTYSSGLYCVTDVAHPWSGTLTARDATFYIKIPDFNLKFAGSGDGFDITAQQNGDYAGYAIVLPLTCQGAHGDIICDLEKLKKGEQTISVCTNQNDTPRLDLRGNGMGGVLGSVLAPTACVTMYGNSSVENHGQVIGYVVDGGGTADINVCFKADENPQELVPPTVQLLK